MANLFFLENEKDTHILQNHLAEDDRIVALSIAASYALERKGLDYELPERLYYSHRETHEALVEYSARIEKIMKYLDNIVFNIDYRFKKLQLGPFYCSLFDTEVPILSMVTRIFEMRRIFGKERPNKVKIIDQGDLTSERVRFGHKGSLINEVIKLVKRDYNYELVIYESKESPHEEKPFNMSKEYRKFETMKTVFIQKSKMCLFYLRNLRNKVFIKKKPNRILNVNSCELRCVMDKLMKYGWVVYNFPSAEFNKNKIERKYTLKRRFEETLEKDNTLREMLEFSGVSYFEIISKQLIKFCDCFEGMLNDYHWLDGYLKNNKFDIAFFHTHSGFNMKNRLFPIVLKKDNIPYICWMHGGYGTEKSVGGYESGDYLLGDRYFVFGKGVKDMIDRHYSHCNLKTYAAGSPYLENRYRDYLRPKNNKKIITYVFSPFGYSFNEVYDKRCRMYERASYWLLIKGILDVLSKYRDDYRIILRPHGYKKQTEWLSEYLKDIKATNIEIISMEKSPLKDILFKSDLVIFDNISTSFFEASMTEADIFLLDDSDLTEEAKKIINQTAFHFREISDFCKSLDRYLKDGKFYIKDKSAFTKEFLDIDSREYRGREVSIILDSILGSTFYKKEQSGEVACEKVIS